jgi:hypothetical protein
MTNDNDLDKLKRRYDQIVAIIYRGTTVAGLLRSRTCSSVTAATGGPNMRPHSLDGPDRQSRSSPAVPEVTWVTVAVLRRGSGGPDGRRAGGKISATLCVYSCFLLVHPSFLERIVANRSAPAP